MKWTGLHPHHYNTLFLQQFGFPNAKEGEEEEKSKWGFVQKRRIVS